MRGLAGLSSRPPPASSLRLDRGTGGLRAHQRDARGSRARMDDPRRLARRGRASSARASARRCCATPPTGPRCRPRRRCCRERGKPADDPHHRPFADPEATAERAAVRDRPRARRARASSAASRTSRSAAARRRRAPTSCSPPRSTSWDGVEIWFADERCVAPEDAESNYRLAAETLLRPAAIDPARVHRMEGELGPERGRARATPRRCGRASRPRRRARRARPRCRCST